MSQIAHTHSGTQKLMASASRIRPYKDFLTPALHRRFAKAAATLVLFCYILAILIGPWDSLFWSWFPFGIVGIRTALIFICAFSIFVLRVAQLHVGIRTTDSPFQTFQQYLFRYQTVQTAAWYFFSAWLFSEVYIFSTPSNTNLRWIIGGNSQERLKLNERPIYLVYCSLMLALSQTIYHLYFDYDRLVLPVKKIRLDTPSDKPPQIRIHPSGQFGILFPQLISNSFKRSFVVILISPLIYHLCIRKFAWDWCLFFAKIFWSLPKSNAVPTVSSAYVMLVGRTLVTGFFLTTMWEVANALFSAYVAEEPLKMERPITYESRDPNGSLLTGLRGKKLQTRAFAFWELVCIADRFEGRRKAIFQDIDRKGGSTWSQILEVCLGVTGDVNSRIMEYLTPRPPPQPVEEPGLPRLTDPLKNDDILSPGSKNNRKGAALANFVGSTIKAHGSPGNRSSIFRTAEKSKVKAVIPKDGKAESRTVHPLLLRGLRGPLGSPFRQTFRRRINAIVLGSPYGYEGLVVDAVNALTILAVCSLKEDQYGNVQRDVAHIIRSFTSTISSIEDFEGRLDMHWTDIEQKRESPEIDLILAALKDSLRDILDAFEVYAEELHLSQGEVRKARAVAALPVQVAREAEDAADTEKEKEEQTTRKLTASRPREPVAEMRERPRERGLPRSALHPAAITGAGDDARVEASGGRRSDTLAGNTKVR